MMETGSYMGVLLAAGKGTRMGALSEHYPKPILPIANKPLLVHQIELLAGLGITDIVILIGYKGFHIAKVLGDGSRFGVRLQYVEQTQMLGIAHALGQMESVIDRPFLLFLGDIYFVPRDLRALLHVYESGRAGAVLAVKHETDPAAIMRNFSVMQDDDGRVRRVIEKPRHVTNPLKGVGLYFFDLSIFDAIRRTHRTAMRDEYEITEAIQVLIDDGVVVRTAEAVEDDINMTFPDDLLQLNVTIAAAQPEGNLIHPQASVHEGAQLRHCVVGARAQIRSPCVLENCLIFEDAVLDESGNLGNVIVTPQQTIRCLPDAGFCQGMGEKT